jgi:predicted nucleic acid-binding protein
VILVDTSVWIDHLRRGDATLFGLLDSGQVLAHPFVIGEIAMGTLSQRADVLGGLRALPRATVAGDAEVLAFIERRSLSGLGIGYVDAHLLASTRLTPDASLWTRDLRLLGVAERMGLATSP